MRRKGRITGWKDDRGFGFIIPATGGSQTFVHISSFANRNRRPSENDLVTYTLAADPKGRAGLYKSSSLVTLRGACQTIVQSFSL